MTRLVLTALAALVLFVGMSSSSFAQFGGLRPPRINIPRLPKLPNVNWEKGYKNQSVGVNYNHGRFNAHVHSDVYSGGIYYRPGTHGGYYSDFRFGDAQSHHVGHGGWKGGSRSGPWPYGGRVDLNAGRNGTGGKITFPLGFGYTTFGKRW